MSTEHRIWEAAYAAAFVADWQETESLADQRPHPREDPFDTAKRVTTAERAMDIADHAVLEYVRWNREECGGETLNARLCGLLPEQQEAP